MKIAKSQSKYISIPRYVRSYNTPLEVEDARANAAARKAQLKIEMETVDAAIMEAKQHIATAKKKMADGSAKDKDFNDIDGDSYGDELALDKLATIASSNITGLFQSPVYDISLRLIIIC
jgi:hypothetical protein